MRAGAPRPDISSGEALKRALLAAKTVGYTSGPSGVYMAALIEQMGIADEIKPKHRGVPSGGTVGTIVASGDAEIGFQQVSELVHIPGIDYIGPAAAGRAEGHGVLQRHPSAARASRTPPRRWCDS